MTTKIKGTSGIEFPDATQQGTAADKGPAFLVQHTGGASVPANTWTKISLTQEIFDTDNAFASSKFQPTVAGYYSIQGSVNFSGGASGGCLASIYKNGASFAQGGVCSTNAAIGTASSVACTVYLNGTTDYVELYGLVVNASTLNNNIATFMSGSLARKP